MPLPPTRDASPALPGGKGRPREDKEERRRRKQEARRREDLVRQPDSWERYRILADVIVEGRHLIDLADHKARFALVIVGAVNMALVIVATRGEVLASLPGWLRPWLTGLLVPYTALGFAFLLYAIETLRPREIWALRARAMQAAGKPPTLGILFWEDIARWEPDALRQTWSDVQMSRILAEAVELARGQALINRAKYAALHRLYLCLRLMIVSAGFMLILAGFFVLRDRP